MMLTLPLCWEPPGARFLPSKGQSCNGLYKTLRDRVPIIPDLKSYHLPHHSGPLAPGCSSNPLGWPLPWASPSFCWKTHRDSAQLIPAIRSALMPHLMVPLLGRYSPQSLACPSCWALSRVSDWRAASRHGVSGAAHVSHPTSRATRGLSEPGRVGILPGARPAEVAFSIVVSWEMSAVLWSRTRREGGVVDGSCSLVSVSGCHPSRVWEERSPPGLSPVSSSRAWDPCASVSGKGAAGCPWVGPGRGRLGTGLLLHSFCPLEMGPVWDPDAKPVLLSLSPLAICFSHTCVLLLLRDRRRSAPGLRGRQPHGGPP